MWRPKKRSLRKKYKNNLHIFILPSLHMAYCFVKWLCWLSYMYFEMLNQCVPKYGHQKVHLKEMGSPGKDWIITLAWTHVTYSTYSMSKLVMPVQLLNWTKGFVTMWTNLSLKANLRAKIDHVQVNSSSSSIASSFSFYCNFSQQILNLPAPHHSPGRPWQSVTWAQALIFLRAHTNSLHVSFYYC